MKKLSFVLICLILLSACGNKVDLPVTASKSDLKFNELAKTWDEGIPLGNAIVGALVWQNDSALRFSLDRVDIWDLRPSDSISGPNNRFAWVQQQVEKGDYKPVQNKFDVPYDRNAAPSKIPGAALEFSLEKIGTPNHVQLYLNNAICEVNWANGTKLQTFVHATEPIGWFVFDNLNDSLSINIKVPRYNTTNELEDLGPVHGQDLRRLGYEQGIIDKTANTITYHQKGWNNFYYDVAVTWEHKGSMLYGVWSVTSSLVNDKADIKVQEAFKRGINNDYKTHIDFWNTFRAKSSVTLPDSILQKQYDNEIYKFGSTTREYSYPISLQAVWTADNGRLPPWKGDYHHDLNTQLSYWPAYTGNYLTEGLGYLNTLWNQRDVYKKYTRQYFEVDGLNIPGVATLTGEPMGGWIQYSMSPTVSAWLAQHFYLHWKYSADRTFLEQRAYPFIKEVATFIENISVTDKNGFRTLPLSSSPEIFDNSIRAWFKDITNYDWALMQFAFSAAAELAGELNLNNEATHWQSLQSKLPDYNTDETDCLTFAKDVPYNSSHRHFSHAMAIHPLGLIDWSQGEKSQNIIKATINKLDEMGPDYWVGYSYSWLGNMKARAFDGEGAAEALRTFAECFCLKNTFHANGDQTKSGKSRFTYRPFTLEGNFAFASGIQEMLLQSHTGVIRIFPAIPTEWKDVSFNNLRAMGAYLICAEKKNDKIGLLTIYSEKGGTVRFASPYNKGQTILIEINGNTKNVEPDENGILIFDLEEGQTAKITSN